MTGSFNPRRVCFSFTRDLHQFTSFPRDGVVSPAPCNLHLEAETFNCDQQWLQDDYSRSCTFFDQGDYVTLFNEFMLPIIIIISLMFFLSLLQGGSGRAVRDSQYRHLQVPGGHLRRRRNRCHSVRLHPQVHLVRKDLLNQNIAKNKN